MPETLAAPAIERVDRPCSACGGFTGCKERVRLYGAQADQRGGDWRSVFDASGRRVGSPLRWCTWEKLKCYRPLMRGKDVLEIGCGPLSELTYEVCLAEDIRYTGLEPERLPSRHVLPFARSLQSKVLSPLYSLGLTPRSRRMRYVRDRFPSAKLAGRLFDVIYGSSSIEHWHEDLEDREASIAAYQADIRACFGLLRPGGLLLLDCPFYLHGNPLFIRGDMDAVARIFEAAPWSSLTYENWRKDHDGLPPYAPEGTLREIARYGVAPGNLWLVHAVARKP